MLELQEQIKKNIFILVMYLVQMKKIRMKMKVRMIMKMGNELIFYNMMFILVNL